MESESGILEASVASEHDYRNRDEKYSGLKKLGERKGMERIHELVNSLQPNALTELDVALNRAGQDFYSLAFAEDQAQLQELMEHLNTALVQEEQKTVVKKNSRIALNP